MNQRGLTAVLLKVLGVWAIIKAIDYIVQLLFVAIRHKTASDTGFSANDLLDLLSVALAPVSYLLIAFFLLRYAERIAAKMFPGESASIPEGARPKDEWYVLALTVIGVVLLVWKVPVNLAVCLHNFAVLREFEDAQWQGALSSADLRQYAWQALLRAAMQLGFGLYLVLGGRGIVAGIRKLRRD